MGNDSLKLSQVLGDVNMYDSFHTHSSLEAEARTVLIEKTHQSTDQVALETTITVDDVDQYEKNHQSIGRDEHERLEILKGVISSGLQERTATRKELDPLLARRDDVAIRKMRERPHDFALLDEDEQKNLISIVKGKATNTQRQFISEVLFANPTMVRDPAMAQLALELAPRAIVLAVGDVDPTQVSRWLACLPEPVRQSTTELLVQQSIGPLVDPEQSFRMLERLDVAPRAHLFDQLLAQAPLGQYRSLLAFAGPSSDLHATAVEHAKRKIAALANPVSDGDLWCLVDVVHAMPEADRPALVEHLISLRIPAPVAADLAQVLWPVQDEAVKQRIRLALLRRLETPDSNDALDWLEASGFLSNDQLFHSYFLESERVELANLMIDKAGRESWQHAGWMAAELAGIASPHVVSKVLHDVAGTHLLGALNQAVLLGSDGNDNDPRVIMRVFAVHLELLDRSDRQFLLKWCGENCSDEAKKGIIFYPYSDAYRSKNELQQVTWRIAQMDSGSQELYRKAIDPGERAFMLDRVEKSDTLDAGSEAVLRKFFAP